MAPGPHDATVRAIRTAATLIISNEVLTGKVEEANVAVLARMLFENEITLRRVVVVPDEVETIVTGVRRVAERIVRLS